MTSIDAVPVKRALISVTDKSGVVDLARVLNAEFGIEIISTGGTARAIAEAGIPVTDVSAVTGFPEMMDGRVKTLHPAVHGGLLALRDHPAHLDAMKLHGIRPIDLLVVNLYAFEKVVADPNTQLEHAIENIDIGGPAMLRSASKNYRSVAVVTDPAQYSGFIDHLRQNSGSTLLPFRLNLAVCAFARTASYDAVVHRYLARQLADDSEASAAGLFPTLIQSYRKISDLRYGENPHQAAALYADGGNSVGVAGARQLHGKTLSYINLLDADAAFSLAAEFDQPAAAVIKHANPCGCAAAPDPTVAFELAYAGDPVAAFGGIVAVNRVVDHPLASAIVAGKKFLEVLIAPDFTPDALEILRRRWADCRLLAVPMASASAGTASRNLKFTSISGGVLIQQADDLPEPASAFSVVTTARPSAEMSRDLQIAWKICKHVKSNAIVIVKDGQLLGAGAGQMSRVTSCRLAIELARLNGHGEKLAGAVAASDAFFPFADGPQLLLDAGITGLIQPGGSKRDADTVELCNQRGAAMIHTGFRHFLH